MLQSGGILENSLRRGRAEPLLLVSFLISVGCAAEKHPFIPGCVSGRSIACTGPGGCAGQQVCGPYGRPSGACSCLDGPAGDAAPDSLNGDTLRRMDATGLEDAPPRDGRSSEGSSDAAANAVAPAVCLSQGIRSLDEFESRFLIPRCGTASCHGPMSVFPPRNLHMPTLIRPTLLNQPGQLNCKGDYYIDTFDPLSSYLLATVTSVSAEVTCPSSGQGGSRMPNRDGMPTIPGPRLSEEEITCLTWWVVEVARSSGLTPPPRDAGPPPLTCHEIRQCVVGCSGDSGCAARCDRLALSTAQIQHFELQKCSLAACPSQETVCRCIHECRAGGACTGGVGTCNSSERDPFCETRCK